MDSACASIAFSAAALAGTLPLCPVEVAELEFAERDKYSPLGLQLSALSLSSAANQVALRRLPFNLSPNHPLEFELAAAERCLGTGDAACIAKSMSIQARIMIHIHGGASDQVVFSAALSVRPTAACWTARALLHPSSWAGARSLVLDSLTLGGQPLLSRGLPATIRISFNHAPAPMGAVYTAANAGDVAALESALAAGCSTEEKDGVSEEAAELTLRALLNTLHCTPPPSLPFLPLVVYACCVQYDCTALWCAAERGHVEAVRTLLVAGANVRAKNMVRGGRGRMCWSDYPSEFG